MRRSPFDAPSSDKIPRNPRQYQCCPCTARELRAAYSAGALSMQFFSRNFVKHAHLLKRRTEQPMPDFNLNVELRCIVVAVA